MTIRTLAGVLAASLALSLIDADAATINWGAATAISGDSDVSTTGTLVGAFNLGLGGVPGTTVNGVAFQSFALGQFGAVTVGNATITPNPGSGIGRQNSDNSANSPFSSLSSSYQTLLQSWAGSDGPWTLTLAGLQSGAQYQFQFWTSSTFFSTDAGVIATAGNAVTLDSNTTNAAGGLGQYAIGTFTANGPSQDITFDGIGQGPINGFQFRLIAAPAVPEPSSFALAAMGSLALAGLARRRKRA